MKNKQSIQTVEKFFEAWNAKDWDRWGAMHSDHAYHAGPDHAQPIRGRDAILAAHTGLGKVFPDFKYEITRIFADDDLVCAEWILTGTHQGPVPAPGGRIEPEGKTVRVPGCFVFHVEGDKIAQYVGHVDFLAMYTQLGALPALSSDVGTASPSAASPARTA